MESKNKKKIFKQFLYAEKLSFSELLHGAKIPSNLLAYFIKKMTFEGILIHKNKKYFLSSKGEKLIPFYTEQEALTPLVVILLLIKKENKILLLKREKRPYKGLWSLISGRLFLDESIAFAVKRIVKEKLNAKAEIISINSVVHERFMDVELKHSFVFFLVDTRILSKPIQHSGIKWFCIKKVSKKQMIASDYWLIKNKFDSKINVVEELVDKKGKRITILE
jgi:ADP-ribose pyrophosphatase YjhB (NUDIX family)